MMIQQLYGDNPLLAGWIISVQLLKDIEENIVVREQTNFVYATVQKGQICSSDRNCITTKIKMSKCAWRKLKKQPGILDSQSVDSVIPNFLYNLMHLLVNKELKNTHHLTRMLDTTI